MVLALLSMVAQQREGWGGGSRRTKPASPERPVKCRCVSSVSDVGLRGIGEFLCGVSSAVHPCHAVLVSRVPTIYRFGDASHVLSMLNGELPSGATTIFELRRVRVACALFHLASLQATPCKRILGYVQHNRKR